MSGKATELPEEEQMKWRDILYREQPYLENVYPGETKNIDTMFVIKDYTIEYFCLSTRPITREYFAVGNAVVEPKGYSRLYRLREMYKGLPAGSGRSRGSKILFDTAEQLPAVRELF